MEINSLFSLAARIINHTGQHLFLTGNAGTGKTTFLRYIRDNSSKKMVVVAPTGVAAINAGGVTMHSFFQLPFGMYIAGARNGFEGEGQMVVNRNTLFKNIKFSKDKIELIRELELLVIDEVSMLRADALDAIDTILRHFRRQSHLPFGGLQVLFIGDLHQLPPVLKQNEASIFYEHYKTPFFFDAHVMREAEPLVVELKHIYRQSDESFIRILNAIRNNNAGYDEMDLLHERYLPDVEPDPGCIILTTHNAKADTVNRQKLEQLNAKEYTFEAEVTGDFSETASPADRQLKLKTGAQVMFIKNDAGENRRWYNGKIATVTHIGTDNDVWVRLEGSTEDLKLEHHVWKNIRYNYDREKDAVEEEDLGSFKQYPVRLAWAITIHKSQGLTFEKAVVDAGQSFAPGQVYVALSRLTSLKGLILHSKIPAQGIAMPEAVIEFCQKEKKEEALESIVSREEKEFAKTQLVDWFFMEKLLMEVQTFYSLYNTRMIPEKPKAMEWAEALAERTKGMEETARKFRYQLHLLLQETGREGYATVCERVTAASDWFIKAMDQNLLKPLRDHYKEFFVKQRTKKYMREIKILEAYMLQLRKGWEQAAALAKGLAEGLELANIQLVKEVNESELAPPEKAEKVKKGATAGITFNMFKEGRPVEEIAEARGLTLATIEGHLANYILSGELDISELIAKERLQALMKAMDKIPPSDSLTVLRQSMGIEATFGEIKLVLSYRKMKKARMAEA